MSMRMCQGFESVGPLGSSRVTMDRKYFARSFCLSLVIDQYTYLMRSEVNGRAGLYVLGLSAYLLTIRVLFPWTTELFPVAVTLLAKLEPPCCVMIRLVWRFNLLKRFLMLNFRPWIVFWVCQDTCAYQPPINEFPGDNERELPK